MMMMVKSGFLKDLAEQARQSPYLVLLFLASVLLSIASFYTTYVGIVPFVDQRIFAWFITAAIQSLLFVVSWRLGFMIADKENVAWVDVLVFVVCFTLSVFFSFSSLFNVIFTPDRQQEASLGRVRDGAAAAVNEAEEKLKTQREAQVDLLRQSGEYARWKTQLLGVADVAQDPAAALGDQLVRQREQLLREAERAAQKARDIGARKGTIQGEIATQERKLGELQARLPAAQAGVPELTVAVEQLDLKIATKKSEVDAEAGGIGDTGKRGCGRVCKGLEKELKKLQAEQASKRDQLKIKQTHLDNLTKDIRDLAEKLSKDKQLFANIDAEIATANQQADETLRASEALGTSGGVGASVQALREFPNKFEEKADPAFLEQAERLCNQLYDNMKGNPALSGRLAGLSCSRGPMMAKVAEILETQAALNALSVQCTGPRARSPYEMGLLEALASASTCLELSKLPFREIRTQRDQLDRLAREEGPNASGFTKTINALFAGEPLALFALAIAFSMDALVLFTGLIGAKSASTTFTTKVLEHTKGDDPEVTAIKALLRNMAAFTGKIDGVRYEGQIDLDAMQVERERDLVGQLLRRNTASSMVLAASAEQPNRFYLRWGALEQLEDLLQKSQQQAAAQQQGAEATKRATSGGGATGRLAGLAGRLAGSHRPEAPLGQQREASRAAGLAAMQGGPRQERPSSAPSYATPVVATQARPAPMAPVTPPPVPVATPQAAADPWDFPALDPAPEPARVADRPATVTPMAAPEPRGADTDDETDLVYRLLMETEPADKPQPQDRAG
jgi:hypothetical protein